MLLLVFILWDLYTTRSALLAGLQAYILGAYVAVGSAVYNYFTGKVYYTNYQRFSPGETNPDGFGFIMALGIPVAWYLAGSMHKSGAGRFLRFVNYVYIPAALLGIALSGTRTALLASVVGMAFGLASLTRLRLIARIAIFLLLASVILVLLPYVQTLKSFQRLGTTGTELTSGDLNNRTNNWREGLASFEEHPLLGVGTNMYRSVNSLATDNQGKVSHNSYLSVLVELGLIGFIFFSIILGITIAQAWRQPKWQSWFWLTVLAVWGIGAFTLTWEARKSTWLFLSFAVVSAALTDKREEPVFTAKRLETPGNQFAITYKEPLTR
jgi:O-antigen ligase